MAALEPAPDAKRTKLDVNQFIEEVRPPPSITIHHHQSPPITVHNYHQPNIYGDGHSGCSSGTSSFSEIGAEA